MKKILAVLLSALLLSSLLIGCGGTTSESMDYAMAEDAAQYENGLYESALGTSADTALPENRKLIKTVYLDAETQDMDTLLASLDTQVSELGGYMEERSIHNGSAYSSYRYRSASLTIRIPADQVDAFVANVADFSNIISSNQTVEDVTLNYVATESRITALQTEEARLLELMESAETMSDLLEIEERLTEVRYELESVTSQLRTYDNLIDYATVYLEVSQVQELTEPEPESFWDRISSGFMESLASLWDFLVEVVIALIVSLPYILLIGIVVAVIVLLVKKGRKKRPADKAPSAQKDEPKE